MEVVAYLSTGECSKLQCGYALFCQHAMQHRRGATQEDDVLTRIYTVRWARADRLRWFAHI